MFICKLRFRKFALVGAASLLATTAAWGATITESFGNASAPNWTFAGSALLTAPSIDTAPNGWLRLINSSGQAPGFAYHSQVLPTSNVITVDFDFALSAGVGAPPADGLTFFLFDSATATFSGGAGGGAFGYLCSAPTCTTADGLAGGALAIGISAGYPSYFVNGVADSIALRGAQTGNYPLIADSAALSPKPYSGARGLTSADPNYRHVHILMIPNGTPGQMAVTVTMQAGGVTTTALNNVAVAGLPSNVRFGFSASEGLNRATQEVRNFSLQTSPPAVAAPALSASMRLLLLAGLATLAVGTLAARRRV
ncbi:MAG: hypothetical protein JSR65_00665 [Proteobacteria bacterium]|nr:hypothetical protein [Pseudomonadota bacterium]